MEAKQIVIKSQTLMNDDRFDQDVTDSFLENVGTLDNFAYKVGVTGEERETYSTQDNLVQLILQSGNEQIIEYFYSFDSDCAIKPMIYRNQF